MADTRETIKWLKAIKEKYIHGGDDDFDEKRRQAIDHAVAVLEGREIDKLEPAQRWIPVTERLPNTIPCGAGTAYSEAVNVLTSGRKVLTAIWDGTDFIADAEFWEAENEEITHWTPVLLPLPDPPKGE